MTTYRLSHLDELEAEAIHIIREVVAEFEKPALLFSGGKDSAVLLAPRREGVLAAAAAVPGRARRHRAQLPRGDRVPRPARSSRSTSGSSSAPCRRTSTAATSSRRPTPGATRNRLQTFTLAPGARGGRLRRRLRRRPAGRGEGARQGAHLLPTRRVRPVEPAGTAARAVEHATTRGTGPASTSVSSRSRTGPSSTSGSTSSRSPCRSRRSTSPTADRSSAVAACCSPSARTPSPARVDAEEGRSRRRSATAPSAT